MNSAENHTGKFILRVSVGFLMLFHGIGKIAGGITYIERVLSDSGWPIFLSNGVYIGETIAPIMLILGFQTRLAAFILMINMFMAIYLVHWNEIFAVTAHNVWSIEVPAFYFLTALAIFFLGPGKYAIDKERRGY